MDNYYTIEEKYLHAVDEVRYGETPKGLQLLNEIITNDPFYARAHYQLGMIYYYDIKNYQTAGYHFKACMELEPLFPDVYHHYLHLIVFLNMGSLFEQIKQKALKTPGVNITSVLNLEGLYNEKNKLWNKALQAYGSAYEEVTTKDQKEEIEESIKRIKDKQRKSIKYQYQLEK